MTSTTAAAVSDNGARPRPSPPWWLGLLAHVPVVSWLFQGALFRGQDFYFRDISVYYYPNYVFLARALEQGVWPLWNPTSDGGALFLMTEPLELLLVWFLGAEWALRLGPPLYTLLAMCGVSALARRLGLGPWGVWAAGALFGLSGFVLSSLSLFELFHTTCWAPWVLVAYLGLLEKPTARRAALLGVAAAIQLSALGAEIILQTGVMALVLTPRLPRGRDLKGLSVAAAVALLLAAPALLGVQALVAGTARAGGFDPAVSLAWSVPPSVLLEAALPGFFGDVHSFSDAGYWGQRFFPEGFPYLPSLYVGPLVLLLAARGRSRRLLLALGVGIALGLGSHGPLSWLFGSLMAHLRAPVKFLFLATLAVSLMAGRGLDRSVGPRPRVGAWVVVPGLAVLAGGLAVLWRPEIPGQLLSWWIPELGTARALSVIATGWSGALMATGAMATGAGLALHAGRRLAPLAGLLACLDLLAVNGSINQTAPDFYELRPAMGSLVGEAATQGLYRWFSFGVMGSGELPWAAAVASRDSDHWLYYMDRQSLLPRTHVIDGLEGAFDEDRVGWAPEGSTLGARQRRPHLYASFHHRLRLANVRWVLSFRPLPAELVTPRRAVKFPEVLVPLLLYELTDALPRAFWVPRARVLGKTELRRRLSDPTFDPGAEVLLEALPPAPLDAAVAGAPPARVEYERLDPHTVRLRTSSPPGFVVVLDGHHRRWRVDGPGGEKAILRANGRYWAVPTPGGAQEYTARFDPPWRVPALSLAFAGAVLALGLGIAKEQPRRPGGNSGT